jgi:hypothetical protein
MPTSLGTKLNELASTFASSVLSAIRSASIDDLLAESGGASRRGSGRRRGHGTGGVQPDALRPPTAKKAAGSRLARRSREDIAKKVGQVVAAVRATRGKGLRAEQIRDALDMERRELPRVLKEGLATKKLRAKGRKRATTYFVV